MGESAWDFFQVSERVNKLETTMSKPFYLFIYFLIKGSSSMSEVGASKLRFLISLNYLYLLTNFI